jgi:hypothetical protein
MNISKTSSRITPIVSQAATSHTVQSVVFEMVYLGSLRTYSDQMWRTPAFQQSITNMAIKGVLPISKQMGIFH